MDACTYQWISAARTHVGRVRANNEDAMLDLPEHGLWVVADGMGGHAYGEVASRQVVDGLRQLPHAGTLQQRVAAAESQLQAINRDLLAEASFRHVPVIGSTVVALLAEGHQCS